MTEVLLPKTKSSECDNRNVDCDNSVIENISCANNSKTFLCSTCGKAFRSKDTLLRHKMSHSGAKPFSCDICQKGLSSAVSLKEHKAKHDEQKLYECTVCHRGFRQNSSYRRHLATHSKVSPYECGLCSRRFAQRAYLRSHMKIHTGERPYLCSPPCGKSFAHLSDLKRHRVLHTGKRPYMCDICGTSFADRSSRRRHQKDHENKPWNCACEMCRSSFKKVTQLEKHMSKIHGVTSLSYLKDLENLRCSANGSSTPAHSENDSNVSAVQTIPNRKDPGMELLVADEQKSPEAISSEVPVEPLPGKERHLHFKNHCDNILQISDPNRDSTLSAHQESNAEVSPENDREDVETSAVLPVSCQKYPLTSVNYVLCPDFSSQEYYEWLTNFVSLCKLLPCPVETELFGKMNQVHKSIMDCLSSPPELVCNRTNFKALIDLSQDLLNIMNGQLTFIFSQLPE